MAWVIQCERLTKLYGPVVGVKDLDLQVVEGTFFGFLGPNGAGKTTTIRLLMGFLRPTAGKALVLGRDAWNEKVFLKREMGFLPDYPGLYDSLSGRDLLDYMARLQRQRPVLQRELLERLELSERDLARQIRGYSRGMRQKLALVQALQCDPNLIIMDEPSEGLDPLMQKALFEVLRELQVKGRTIFMSSHVLSEVERWCQRVAIIRQGSVVVVEDVATLRTNKVRNMEVVLSRDAPELNLDLPCVLSAERNGRTLHMKVRGDINPLLQELSKAGVEDMVYEPARLEDIFMEYYARGQGGH